MNNAVYTEIVPVDLASGFGEDDLNLNCPPLPPPSGCGRPDSPTELILNEIYSLSDSSQTAAIRPFVIPPPPVGGGGDHGTIGIVSSGESSSSLLLHGNNSEGRPVCKYCGKDFKNRNTLNNHTSVYHREEKKRMKSVDEII